jgi:hypothetical protein
MRGPLHSFVATLRRLAPVAAVAALLAASAVTAGAAEKIDFTELAPNTPADGATVKGVLFHFSVNNTPSPDARFTVVGPGVTSVSTAPNLEGDSRGVLSLDFLTPVRDFGFSVVGNTQSPSPNAFTLTLVDTAGGTSTKDIAIANLGVFAGARFDDATGRSFVRAVIKPNASAGPRFIVDNVTFTPVPEPGAILTALASAGLLLRRRRGE